MIGNVTSLLGPRSGHHKGGPQTPSTSATLAMDRKELLENPPFELSDADRTSLSQRDEDFVPETWEFLCGAIGTPNNIIDFSPPGSGAWY